MTTMICKARLEAKCDTLPRCNHGNEHECSDPSGYCRKTNDVQKCVPVPEALWVCHLHESCQVHDVCARKKLHKEAFDNGICGFSHINGLGSRSVCDIPYVYPPKEAPAMPEYEILKPVSIKALEESGACERELHRFAFLAIKGMRGNRSKWEYTYEIPLTLDFAISIASQCEGGIDFLLKAVFIKEKVEPLKVGDRVIVNDGSWSYMLTSTGKKESFGVYMKQDSPMEVLSVCPGLPTKKEDPYDEIEDNDLVLRGQSGKVYFSNQKFVKRV
jgi:hypothetical protein